jgi:hypothetical protein
MHSNRHIKAQLGSQEIRRFVLPEPSYGTLDNTVRNVFGLSPTTDFSLKWMDDEGDWVGPFLFEVAHTQVSLSSDGELKFALDCSSSLLRVLIMVKPDLANVTNPSPPFTPSEDLSLKVRDFVCL